MLMLLVINSKERLKFVFFAIYLFIFALYQLLNQNSSLFFWAFECSAEPFHARSVCAVTSLMWNNLIFWDFPSENKFGKFPLKKQAPSEAWENKQTTTNKPWILEIQIFHNSSRQIKLHLTDVALDMAAKWTNCCHKSIGFSTDFHFNYEFIKEKKCLKIPECMCCAAVVVSTVDVWTNTP